MFESFCNRFAVLAAGAVLAAAALPCGAGVTLDLSYVDQQSTQFQRFKGFVDEAVGGNPDYGFSATDAAYMFKLTGQAQYAALAVQTVEDQVTAAEAAIAAHTAPEIAHDSYLYVGGMLRDVAVVYDWCSASLSPTQRSRWSAYAEQAVWNVWHPEQAQWGGQSFPWSGWSITNPANNYYYSFIEATMYWGLAANSTTWLDLLRNDKLPALANYMAGLQGGGSQEGTGYGLSHRTVFSLYRLWRDATGTDLANANAHLTDSIAWWMHATVPTRDRVAPIGDQSRVSVPVIYDYHRDLVLEARRMTADVSAQDHASWWLHSISDTEMESGFNFHDDLLPSGTGGTPPAALVYHGVGTGQLFARTGWDTGAMWLQFSAGPYVESHAHQDQGSFTLFQNDWLAVTENIWSHSGIQQGTEVHNQLRFEHAGDIVQQHTDTVSTMSYSDDGGTLHVEADLTAAYGGDTAVGSWVRTLDFVNRTLTIHDHYATGSGTEGIFAVNVPVQPTISGLTARAGALRLTVISPANATLSRVDWHSVDSDYLSGWRIDVRGGNGDYIVELSADDGIFADGFD